ncbi:MAG: FAD-dependent monooxygenase, partial [Planctomycetota bacterium]
HALDGKLTFQPYGKNEQEVIYSISRGGLNKSLMTLAEKKGAKIHFNRKCTGINFQSRHLHLYEEETHLESLVETNLVIGTDGSASAIRLEMQKKRRFNYSQVYLEHGYKELCIPPGPNNEFLLEKNALHIWPRGTYMLIALPNSDASFTCTLFFPMEGEFSFETLDSEESVLHFFQKQFPDALPLMPTLIKDFFENLTGTLMTVKCSPWSVDNLSVLLGDAAHAIVPFFGQGMNCSFEDCFWFDECIARYGTEDWEKIFKEFEKLRKINTDAIADLAVENFIEMRDRVGDPHFLFKKKVGLLLEAKYPVSFIPKYSLVSFHRVPYAVALKMGQIQEGILDEICSGIHRIEEINWEKVKKLIQERLNFSPLEMTV